MASKKKANLDAINKYVDDVINGKKIVGKEVILACIRYKKDLKNPKFEFRTHDAEFVLGIIEMTMTNRQGEALDGTSLKGKPLKLQTWQKFIVYNLLCFFYRGTKERRYKEAFIFVPRKNGKTTFIAGLAWGLALLERASGSKIYIVAAALKQARESFDFILYNLREMEEIERFRVLDNNAEHSISCSFYDDDEKEVGSIRIEALASNPDTQDSFNCNIAIADEIHAFKKPAQYNRFKEAMKAYTNKFMLGITTAGDNMNSFCYDREQYAIKVVNKTVQDDSLFVFISKADQDDKGNVDYMNPIQWEKANPSYGITIRPSDMANDALQAQNDPKQRKDFISRSLNVYTTAINAYFNIDEFRYSDRKYNWTIEELAKLPIKWYGGADLSKMFDLTAACLYGSYGDVDIIIPHCWFPITAAAEKSDQDNIPLFGWKDDGWLDMCNGETVNYSEVINWFIKMRDLGFNIVSVGHDRKFCREYFVGMKLADFNIVDQPQYYYKKSEGFRHIERKAKESELYYLHAEPYEYCVQNVKAIEKTDDMVQYEKIKTDQRIDIFDASVFACIRRIEAYENESNVDEWWE